MFLACLTQKRKRLSSGQLERQRYQRFSWWQKKVVRRVGVRRRNQIMDANKKGQMFAGGV